MHNTCVPAREYDTFVDVDGSKYYEIQRPSEMICHKYCREINFGTLYYLSFQRMISEPITSTRCIHGTKSEERELLV